jgi:hypothetical protein
MKNLAKINSLLFACLFALAGLCLPQNVLAQTPDWSTGGNISSGTEKLGNLDGVPLHIVTAGTDRIIIKGDGHVGIGTDKTDGYTLSVDSNIRAREIVVNSDTWSDYVFDSCYNLVDLATLEQQIKEQGHLPDVPSAQEVAANGVAVGEMNKILLAKVEELTLYMIQLEKQVKELQQAQQAAQTKTQQPQTPAATTTTH